MGDATSKQVCMCSCIGKNQYQCIGFFFPNQEPIRQNVALLTILIIAFQLVRFIFGRNGARILQELHNGFHFRHGEPSFDTPFHILIEALSSF